MLRASFLRKHHYALIASFALWAVSAGGATEARFVQNRFAVGLWVDPPVDNQAEKRYAELAAANFTFVIGNFGARKVEDVRRQIALCEQHGLKLIASMAGLPPEQLPESPACWGYYVADEPGPGAFAELRLQVDALRKARPASLAFINLFPNYAPASALGGTYVEHVSRFIREVQPDVLSMDHYPHFKPDADGREAYCQNLEVMREQSLAAKIPFWNFFNSMPFGDHSDPTEAQLRWQINASLAYGAKGVMYFCYWTPTGDEFPKGGAIVQTDGRRTRHYEEAKRLNARLKQLGPTLMQLTSTGTHRIRRKEDPPAVLKTSGISSLSAGEYLVGTFQHADGRRAVLLTNYEFAYSAWPTVAFDVEPGAVVEVNPQSGKEEPLRDDSPAMAGLQLSLDAGDARLILLPKK